MDYTEEQIRRVLDGTFTTLFYDDYGPYIRTKNVERDFMGSYAPPNTCAGAVLRMVSHEEDDKIVELRQDGHSYKAIGLHIGLSSVTVRDRYIAICKERGLKAAKPAERKSSMCPEFQARVAKLKDKGMSLSQITIKLQEDYSRVCYAWELERKRRMREAA